MDGLRFVIEHYFDACFEELKAIFCFVSIVKVIFIDEVKAKVISLPNCVFTLRYGIA